MEQRHTDDGIHEQGGTGRALKRRGLIAGAAALVAGMAARRGAQPVGATHQPEDLGLGIGNATADPTSLFYSGAPISNTNILSVADLADFSSSAPAALAGYAQGNKITNGVFGYSIANAGSGVVGKGAAGVVGVYGESSGTGTGVKGYCVGGNGVYGVAQAAGTSQVVAGVFGDSTTTYGIIGRTTASGYSGLTAITSTPNVAALGATATVPTAYAAFFTGTTVVNGNFVATGGTKSAAVKDATGQHRLVYCVESPEAWFEDFGTAKLVNGKADVTLDKTFAEIVHTDEYHVFLAPDGDCKGLYTTHKGATGFSVREMQGGASSLGFSYRVVAKRKDIAGERLAKWDMPKIKHPDPDKLPKPEPPKK